MSKLLLTFYGDDFTGSTDALEQLALAGIRTLLFIQPPTPGKLRKFPGLQAIGVAGMTRAMTPNAMERELRPAFKKLKTLGARHVHYKVCSTFDSSPGIGSIGRAIDIGAEIFPSPFVPVLAAAPSLGRYTLFGNHFARYGIGSAGSIHRLDRHPSISKHPVTPMTEADLRVHLRRQTKKRIALFDILKVAQPADKARATLKQILNEKPNVVLFDAIANEHLGRIGELLEDFASAKLPLFSVGSSGIEAALAAQWRGSRHITQRAGPAKQLLVGSGSCSPVTFGEIDWALKNGGANGPNVKTAFYQKKDWVPTGMEGVCNPSTWTDKDHRGSMKVDLYRSKVTGATDGDINDLMAKGTIKLEKVKAVELPRKPEWFGW